MQPIAIAVGIGNTSIHVGVTRDTSCFPRWLQRLELRNGTFEPAQLEGQLPTEQGRWYNASVHRPNQERLVA
jgi:hypothetical protein